uniref:Uncharacterized protein n=1 Tax=Aplanochytrium stocchinoi TaxID=215587 RepID=A0A7S3LQ10_9STRA|mmetsp:Transcript_18461/g.22619  ORF Transcript_18461/g.22619 Transcript_18461/m.22619 type:complete len:142 (-) Transcript_18461:161-586(-)
MWILDLLVIGPGEGVDGVVKKSSFYLKTNVKHFMGRSFQKAIEGHIYMVELHKVNSISRRQAKFQLIVNENRNNLNLTVECLSKNCPMLISGVRRPKPVQLLAGEKTPMVLEAGDVIQFGEYIIATVVKSFVQWFIILALT